MFFPVIVKCFLSISPLCLSKHIHIIHTTKPLNTGHSRSLKFCPLFGGVRYSEGEKKGRKKIFVHQLITMYVHKTFIQCNNDICDIFVLFVCIII